MFIPILLCLSHVSADSGWTGLRISPSIVASVRYRGFQINIYEHEGNQGKPVSQRKYYYPPLALFEDVRLVHTRITKRTDLEISLRMWGHDEVPVILERLRRSLGPDISDHNIELLPVERIILTPKRPLPPNFSLPRYEYPYSARSSEIMTVKLECQDNSTCNEVIRSIRDDPKVELSEFTLGYVVHGVQVKEKRISMSQSAFHRLMELAEGKTTMYLSSELWTRQLTQLTMELSIRSFTDNEAPVTNDLTSYLERLLHNVVTVRSTGDGFSSWNNVVWDPPSERPDLLAKRANEGSNILSRAALLQLPNGTYVPKHFNLYKINLKQLQNLTGNLNDVSLHYYTVSLSTCIQVATNLTKSKKPTYPTQAPAYPSRLHHPGNTSLSSCVPPHRRCVLCHLFGNCVVLYDDDNCDGAYCTLGQKSIFNLQQSGPCGNWANRASSLEIIQGCSAKLCYYANLAGTCHTYQGGLKGISVTSLGHLHKNAVSLECKCQP